MKKILITLVLGLALVSVQAQNYPFSPVNGAGEFKGTKFNPTATISNATLDTVKYALTGQYSKIGFDLLVTKSTGTMAGKARLYAAGWDTASAYIQIDSVALTAATVQAKHWEVVSPTYRYFMVVQSEATTVTGRLRVKATGLKQ